MLSEICRRILRTLFLLTRGKFIFQVFVQSLFFFLRKSHQRTKDAKSRRNKVKKERRKSRKRSFFEASVVENAQVQKRIRDLERTNFLLKTTLQKSKTRERIYCVDDSAKSLKATFGSKSLHVIKTVKHEITLFPDCDVSIEGTISSGAFGTVQRGRILSCQSNVAIKTVDSKLSTLLDVKAEAKFLLLVNGHPNFPFFYGMTTSKKLIFELILNADATSTTLYDALSLNISEKKWIEISVKLCAANHDLHINGVLHNDLHMRNILLRNREHLKVIDFGKATLISDPVVYQIKVGSEKQKKYNHIYRHLAYELRNISGSGVSIQSDIFTVGYNIDRIGSKIRSKKLSMSCMNMMNKDPLKRPTLSSVILDLEI